jgi:hypothetical protein
MPEGDKAFFRAVLTALGEGRKPAEVKRIGEEARARFMALGAGLSAAACIQTDPSRVS